MMGSTINEMFLRKYLLCFPKVTITAEGTKVVSGCSCRETKEYLLKLQPEDAVIAFAYTSGVVDVKCQRQYNYNDLICRACGVGEDYLHWWRN